MVLVSIFKIIIIAVTNMWFITAVDGDGALPPRSGVINCAIVPMTSIKIDIPKITGS